MVDLSAFTMDEGLEYFRQVNKRTNAINNMIERCGVSGECFVSTKDWGQIIVIHHGTNLYEAESKKITEIEKTINYKSEFWNLLRNSGLFKLVDLSLLFGKK